MCKGLGRIRVLHGFTFVELLMVLALVALLIAILLPVLRMATATAERLQCLSNQRQLVSAWLMYANENRGWLCKFNATYNLNSSRATPWLWDGTTPETGIIALSKYHPSFGVGTPSALWPYLKSTKVYRCPSLPPEYFVSYAGNYVLNGKAPGGPYVLIKQLSRIKHPDRTFVFIEHIHPGVYETYPCQHYVGGTIDWIPDPPATWHEGGCVLSFADGHGEYHAWMDPRTLHATTFNIYSPGNKDAEYLFDVSGKRN